MDRERDDDRRELAELDHRATPARAQFEVRLRRSVKPDPVKRERVVELLRQLLSGELR